MYNRATFHLVENFKKELFNLNNQIVLLLPPFEVLAKRFQKRGDPIQNMISLKRLYQLFSEFTDEYMHLPNVTVVTKELDDRSYDLIAAHFLSKERNFEIHNLPEACMRSADSQDDKEVVGLRLTYFDDGEFTDNRRADQDKTSRRIIYHDDSCISLAHFLIRDQIFDAKFFLRSSNVKDTLKYDINFIHYLTQVVYQMYECKQPVKIEVTLNSAHICDRIESNMEISHEK